MPALTGNRTSSESISLRAPGSTGTYYYGACVDAVGGESDTGNNCSIGVRVVVSSSSDDHGDTRATATPIGSNSSTPGTLDRGDFDYFRLVLSARTTLTAESTGNTDTFGRLMASDGSVLASNDDGAGSGVNFRIREEVSAGTYYIQVSGFLNAAGPYTLVVSSAGTPSEIPDLVVESPAVSSGAVAPDESFTLSATVRNQGAGAAGSTTLRYYQSRDSTITTGDTGVGTDAVPALTGNRTSSESISLRAPGSTGTYYYGACVDAVGGESDTGNNCSIGVRVVVSGGGTGSRAPGPCGIPFDEAIAVTRQCSNGNWWASGPIQDTLFCDEATESGQLAYVVNENLNGFFLERIGTADFQRREDETRSVGCGGLDTSCAVTIVTCGIGCRTYHVCPESLPAPVPTRGRRRGPRLPGGGPRIATSDARA